MTIRGFDTETFQGQVKLLACSDGAYVETDRTDDLLDFLYQHGRGSSYNVWWNMGFDVSVILRQHIVDNAPQLREAHYKRIQLNRRYVELEDRLLVDGRLSTEEIAERKALKRELDDLASIERIETARYKVWLIADKGIRLTPVKRRRKDRSVYFFDVSQFYSAGFGGARLETAAQQYLGEGKSDGEEGLSREAIGEVPGYYEANREAIIRYCVRDCELTARLMATTVSSFERLGFSFPEHPWSKAAIARQYLKDTGVMDATQEQYAKLDNLAERSYWRGSYRGGVFATRTIGLLENGFALDLNSAYPAAMASFPSLEGAYVVDGRNPECLRASFRFYRIRAPPSPRLAVRDPTSDRLFYVDGPDQEPRTWLVAEPDLRAMKAYGDPFEIVDVIGVVCPSQDKPLGWMREVYDRKSEVKKQYGYHSAEYWGVKIVLNGVYGLLAQRRPVESKYTNFVYASYITAICREKLWLKALEVERAGGEVHAYATDGLLVTGIVMPDSDNRLGQWSSEPFKECVILGNGIYVRDGDLRRRGLPGLTAEALKECDLPYIELTKKSPLKMRSAIIQRRAEAIGSFREMTRTLDPPGMLADAGFSVPDDLKRAPLKSYWSQTWRLKWPREVPK